MATQPTVTMKQIAAELADKHNMSKKDVESLLGDMGDLVTKYVKKGNKVRFPSLFIAQVRHSAARMGRNPATGEQIKIPAKKKVSFRPTKELKDSVL